MSVLLLLMVSFGLCECFNIKDHYAYGSNRMFDNIIQSYVKPMKQLSASFPNHEVELEVEIQAPITTLPKLSGRRKFYLYRPPKILRNSDPKTPPTTKEIITTTTLTSSVQETTPPSSSAATTTNIEITTSATPGKREPVYKDDLDKVIDRIEKKISETTRCPGYHRVPMSIKEESPKEEPKEKEYNGDTDTEEPNDVTTKPVVTTDNTEENNPHLTMIMELLKKKGIKLRKDLPLPRDDNLRWIQIKIPRNAS